MRLFSRSCFVAALSFGLVSCWGTTGRPLLRRASTGNETRLAQAAEDFYRASRPEELRSALAAAKKLDSGSSLSHELAAKLAFLEDRPGDELTHLEAALLDPSDDAALLHLHRLAGLWSTVAEGQRLRQLFDRLRRVHPEPQVRATAAYLLAGMLHDTGDLQARDAAAAEISGKLDLAIIGGWDNDQGRGFEQSQPPEQQIDLAATYPGALLTIGWRPHPPVDFRGELYLHELLSPSKWSVAFATGSFSVSSQGPYELRISTSDPLEVWLDGAKIFSAPDVREALFDQLVLPLALQAGVHRVLLKSANREGSWTLSARVTAPRGEPTGFSNAPAGSGSKWTLKEGFTPVSTPEKQITSRLAITTGPARKAALESAWAMQAGSGAVAARIAEKWAAQYPGSLLARFGLAVAMTRNGDKGRALDLLGALDNDFGAQWVRFPLWLAHVRPTENHAQKVKVAQELTAAHPESLGAWNLLAEFYQREGWNDDRCRLLQQLETRFPDRAKVGLDLADCLEAQGFTTRANEWVQQTARVYPSAFNVLREQHRFALLRGDFGEAAHVAERLVAAFPQIRWSRLTLAEDLRRLGRSSEAEQVLNDLVPLNPDAADSYKDLARLAFQRGDGAKALQHWKLAAARDPKDEQLVRHLNFLFPSSAEAWAVDVPDADAISTAVALGSTLKAEAGAEVLVLLDHNVTQMNADGSTAEVVTRVDRAVTTTGRDQLTQKKLSASPKCRVMLAYAIDASGKRLEPSSIRGCQVWFRGLNLGATVVTQYRVDDAPNPILPTYPRRSFSFQNFSHQFVLSQWVLWLPRTADLHEDRSAGVLREEKTIGDLKRVTWTMRDQAPVLLEPRMLAPQSRLAHVTLSTLPSWEIYLAWERGLLNDVFRGSPQLEAVAQRLFEGVSDPAEKLARLQTYLMDEIRYKQDYEDTIAGVKPHAASMVIERGYGDCKDKAVLFIALAKKAGLTAEFALLRTRPLGPVVQEVPEQQFNHAIVYLPQQAGVPEARFFDGTADALDLAAVPAIDQGANSLVFDPLTKSSNWRSIPFQSPEHNGVESKYDLSLSPDGSVRGSLQVEATGDDGSLFRRVSRSPNPLIQTFQLLIGTVFAQPHLETPEVLEVKNYRAPAKLRVAFTAPAIGQRENEDLRIKLPSEKTLKEIFSLSERKHPVSFTSQEHSHSRVNLHLPAEFRVKSRPASLKLESRCLSFTQESSSRGQEVQISRQLFFRCPEIAPAEYPAERAMASLISQALEENLVLTTTHGKRVTRR